MSGETEGSPLAAVQVLESTAFRLGQVARRLLADHPDAELTVNDCHVFGHSSGDGSSQLALRAADVDTARAVCAALGIEVHARITDYGLVMEHVGGEITLDGVAVQVRAHRRLSVEEAAAWRAEQPEAGAA